jgi:molecular chaperone DnaK
VAVYDLGGGTFDVSIIELNQGVIEVRASHGDTHLGGDDFDARLVDWLAERFMAEYGSEADPRANRKALARLTRAAETAKITLSTQPFAAVREEYLLEHNGQALHLEDEISRHDFEELIHDLLEGTLTAFDQALEDAGLKASDLEKILFVGGSTRISLVWELVAAHTGLEPMVEVNPDEAVALGAGVQAAIIAGEPLEAVLVDVTPHSLGIEVAEQYLGRLIPDHYGVIIRRNTTLPTTRAQVFSAITPEQTAIEVKVYQGEAPIASQNTLLGEFLFEGLRPEMPGEPPHVTVEFDLDLNGILKVSATDRGSRRISQTTLRAAHTRLTPSDQAASAHYLDGLWEAAALAAGEAEAGEPLEPLDELAAAGEADPLLDRARRLLVERASELKPLADLVRRLEAAQREGRAEAAAELGDQLLNMLYDLEEDDEADEP